MREHGPTLARTKRASGPETAPRRAPGAAHGRGGRPRRRGHRRHPRGRRRDPGLRGDHAPRRYGDARGLPEVRDSRGQRQAACARRPGGRGAGQVRLPEHHSLPAPAVPARQSACRQADRATAPSPWPRRAFRPGTSSWWPLRRPQTASSRWRDDDRPGSRDRSGHGHGTESSHPAQASVGSSRLTSGPVPSCVSIPPQQPCPRRGNCRQVS